MVIAMFGPVAALIGVPLAARYYRRGGGSAAWVGAGACLVFSFVSAWSVPGAGHAPFEDGRRHDVLVFVWAFLVAWAALWMLWSAWSRRRVSGEVARRRSGTTAWW